MLLKQYISHYKAFRNECRKKLPRPSTPLNLLFLPQTRHALNQRRRCAITGAMQKTILFATYGGGHAHMVYPVIHAIRATGAAVTIKVLALPAAKETLRRGGVECFGFRDYLDPVKDADAMAWGTELAKTHHSPTIGVELEDSIAYLGLNYKDLVTRLGEAEAAALFKAKIRHAFYPTTILERIISDIKPDFVVTSNSPRAEAATIEVANRHGINTLIMTDLFTGLGDYKLKGKNVTFLNSFAKDMFLSDGLVDETTSEFHITGNPAFDKILNLPKDKDAAWLAEHFPGVGSRPAVLHADMPAYWDPVNMRSYNKTEADILSEMEACYTACLATGAAYLVRPHPSQERAFYANWVAGREGSFLAADCNLHELLRSIDLLIARTTTVGLEAAYMEKRILQLDADYHTDMPLAKMGIAWGVNSYEELPAAIESALRDDKKLEEINNRVKQIFPREPAADKIAHIILGKL